MSTWVLILFLLDGSMAVVVPDPNHPNGYSSERACKKEIKYAKRNVKDLASAECVKVEK